MVGTLYVVATPLGHLEDLSRRAERVLREASLVACEDTRRTAKLLARWGIETRTISCHRFNERERLAPVISELLAGRDVALVSDGGTPAISDPGALLVEAARDAGASVRPVPGPSAAAAILSISGLPADRYVFEGYLPPREGERRRRLRAIRGETRTTVALEAPHRLRAALRDIGEILGGRRVVLGRELTKLHEEILAGTAAEILASFGDREIRGEIAMAIAGATEPSLDLTDSDESARRALAAWRSALEAVGGDRREALKRAAKQLGTARDALRRQLDELGE